MPNVTDHQVAQHPPGLPEPSYAAEPIRITEDVPPPPRPLAVEIRNARAALDQTGDWDSNTATDTRDASVLLHYRLTRLLDALDAERTVTR